MTAVHARVRLPVAFARPDAPDAWPPPRGRPRPEALARGLESLPGVGPTVRRRLAALGLRTVGDLLAYRPFRYEAAAPELPIADVHGEEEVVVVGTVRRVSSRRPRRRLTVQTAIVADESGEIGAVWFNQPWVAERLRPGTRVRLRGQLRRGDFAVKTYDLGEAAATADFAPVYPASEEVPSRRLRELVGAALPHARDLADPLPAALKARELLPLRADALVALHRPRDGKEAEA